MKPELKKLLVLNLPYLLFVYLFAKCGQAYRLAAGADASAKLLHLTSGISAAFANPLPSLHPFDLCVGVAGAVAVRLIVYSKGKNAKKYRKGEEYGSARWGTAKDIAPYIANPQILSVTTCSIMMAPAAISTFSSVPFSASNCIN